MLGFTNMTADFDVHDYIYEITPEGPVLVQIPEQKIPFTTPDGKTIITEVEPEPEQTGKKNIPWWVWAILAGITVAQATRS